MKSGIHGFRKGRTWRILPILLFVFLGSGQNSMAAQSEDYNIAFQFVRLDNTDLVKTLAGLLTEQPDEPYPVVASALSVLPEQTRQIVSESISMDVAAEVIAEYCKEPMDERQTRDLVSSLIAENADVQMVLDKCLTSVPSTLLMAVLMSTLQASDPQSIETILRLAFDMIELRGLDGRTVLVDALVEGDFLVTETLLDDGCSGECLRPVAEVLVENLLDETNVETDPTLLSEPPSSAS